MGTGDFRHPFVWGLGEQNVYSQGRFSFDQSLVRMKAKKIEILPFSF